MFDHLTQRMTAALRSLRGVSKLSEQNVSDSLQEVKTALLGADVHFKVVRDFIQNVKEKALGAAVTPGVAPGQMIVKVLHDELVKLLGEGNQELKSVKPLLVLVVGLHGSGKTTTAAKLAYRLKKKGYTPLVVGCDVYRPAAIDQLEAMAKHAHVLFYSNKGTQDVLKIAREAQAFAQEKHANAIIFDTAGRLQIDAHLIEEVKQLRKLTQPHEVLLVADGALGQEAVNVATHFHEALDLTGIILTKLDGDARGGAALSMKAMTGVPLRYLGVGEKVDQLELFHADRMAQRILGMGDVVSFVEKAQEVIDEKEAEKMVEKIKKATFNLDDFLTQMRQMKKIGPLGSLVKMMPGMSGMSIGKEHLQEMDRVEVILQSMTRKERQNPDLLKKSNSRCARVAKGSGTQLKDVNDVLSKFEQMRKMMQMLQGGKGMDLMRSMSKQMGKGGPMMGKGGGKGGGFRLPF
jgi:signal recognition particle subunit SRP54